MQLLLFRHGPEESRAQAPDGTDASRRLTSAGEDAVRETARTASRLGARPGLILTSPLARARRTAELVRPVLNVSAEVRIEGALEPEGYPEPLYDLLASVPPDSEVLLVTHLPLLRAFLAEVLAWDLGDRLALEAGALASVTVSTPPRPGSGQLCWLLPGRSRRS